VVNALVVINEVTLRRARLVLRWVRTGKPSRYVTSHPGQLSLAIPPWVDAVSISESWGVSRHSTRYTSPVFAVSQCKLSLVEGKGNGDERRPMGLVAREGLYSLLSLSLFFTLCVRYTVLCSNTAIIFFLFFCAVVSGAIQDSLVPSTD